MWSAARSAKISMILCMPERVFGGDAKFQGFCDRWNKWEGHPAVNPYVITGTAEGAHLTDLQKSWRRVRKAAMLSSPRRPDTTIRIFSSAVYCLRVLRRISRTVLSAGSFLLIDFCLIFVPFGHYDEPEILRYAITSICPKGADVRHLKPKDGMR